MDLSSLKRKHYRRIKVEKFVEKRIFQNPLYFYIDLYKLYLKETVKFLN